MKTSTIMTLAGVATGVLALAVAGYGIYYAARYGPKALTPAESWLLARINRKGLDRVLADITAEVH